MQAHDCAASGHPSTERLRCKYGGGLGNLPTNTSTAINQSQAAIRLPLSHSLILGKHSHLSLGTSFRFVSELFLSCADHGSADFYRLWLEVRRESQRTTGSGVEQLEIVHGLMRMPESFKPSIRELLRSAVDKNAMLCRRRKVHGCLTGGCLECGVLKALRKTERKLLCRRESVSSFIGFPLSCHFETNPVHS